MKRLFSLFLIILTFFSCEKGPEQKTQDRNYILDEITRSVITEDDIDSYLIDLALKGQGYNVSIIFGSNVAEIRDGEYKIGAAPSTSGTCKLTLNDGKSDKEITHGTVKVNRNNDIYTISIDIIVGVSAKYSFTYEGNIAFESEITPYKNVTLTGVANCIAVPENSSFRLELSLEGNGCSVSLTLNNGAAVLPEGRFAASQDYNTRGNCKLILNNGKDNYEISNGEVDIESKNGIYTIKIDAIVSVKEKYSLVYEGNIEFDIDFTPSANSVLAMEANITTYNQYWQEEIVEGVSKYTVLVIDPSDKAVASLELVSEPGKTLAELVGEYTIGTENVPGTLKAGANSWGTISGSYYYDENNIQTFITKGTIAITNMTDNDGIAYYSISGSNLTSKNGSLDIKFVKKDQLAGTVIRNSVISSKKMNKSMKYSLYLPAGYEEGTSYPILYLLHGYGDENNAWLDKGNLMMTARSYEKNGGNPMIVVCPDGLTEFYQGRWENYMYEELMPEVESKYKFNGKRAVAGLSMGGYGSLYYWCKYSDMYCYAYAMSPAVDVNGTAKLLVGKDKSTLPSLTIETGIQDQTTSLTSITEFHNYLVSEDIEHEFITRDGSHDWKFWQECLPKALNKCGESFE